MVIIERKAKIQRMRRCGEPLVYLPPECFRPRMSGSTVTTELRAGKDFDRVLSAVRHEPRVVIATDDTDAGAWFCAATAAQLRAHGYAGEIGWMPQPYVEAALPSAIPPPDWRARNHEMLLAAQMIFRSRTAAFARTMYRGGKLRLGLVGCFLLARLIEAARTGTVTCQVVTAYGEVTASLHPGDVGATTATLIDSRDEPATAEPLDTAGLIDVAVEFYGRSPEEAIALATTLFDLGYLSCPFEVSGGYRPELAHATYEAARRMVPDGLAAAPQHVDEDGRALATAPTPDGKPRRLPGALLHVLSAIRGHAVATQMRPGVRRVSRYRVGTESELTLRHRAAEGPDRVLGSVYSDTRIDAAPPTIGISVTRRYGAVRRYGDLFRDAAFVRDPRIIAQDIQDLVRFGLAADVGIGLALTPSGYVLLRDMSYRMPELRDRNVFPAVFGRIDRLRREKPDPTIARDLLRWTKRLKAAPDSLPVGRCGCGGSMHPTFVFDHLSAQCRDCQRDAALEIRNGRIACAE